MSSGLTGAAGLLGGVSQYEAGQSRSMLFNANAGVARQQAQSELEAGSINESAIRRKGAAVQGEQVANIGGNNLQQAGTPAQVVSSTAQVNEMDALTTRNNAMRKAWGFQVQEASDQKQASFARATGNMSAAGTILGGGAKAYTQADETGSWF